jgi:hypothetical protein
VAFVALFFALGGGAMAAAPYIKPADPIPAGGDLAGTYGTPLISSGKVTTDKLADGAVTTGKLADGAVTTSKFASSAQAPDAAKLAGAGPNDYGAVMSGRINGLNSVNGLQYGAPSGISTASANEQIVSTLAPDHVLQARDLSVQLTAPPGTFAARRFTVLINGVPGPSCSIANDETTCTASGPSNNIVSANSTLSIEVDSAQATGADARFAFRLTN